MKKITKIGFALFDKIYTWLKEKSLLGIQRSGVIIIVSFILSGGICSYTENEAVHRMAAFLFFFILFLMIFFFIFDSKMPTIIRKITKNKYSSIRDLMRKMSHFSYLYGVCCFSITMSVFLYLLIICVCVFVTGKVADIQLSTVITISIFLFSFIYFLYHIYVSNEIRHIEEAKKRIQLYAAIGTTITFLMLLIGEIKLLKIVVSGILVEYPWLQYLIAEEQD